jgi:hypothetical protein
MTWVLVIFSSFGITTIDMASEANCVHYKRELFKGAAELPRGSYTFTCVYKGEKK